jgi:hypothetical protein
VAPLRELRLSLGEMRLFANLAVGRDGRNRCLLSPFRSKTGRNQPSNAKLGIDELTRRMTWKQPQTHISHLGSARNISKHRMLSILASRPRRVQLSRYSPHFVTTARLFASDVVRSAGFLASFGSLAHRFPSNALFFSE